MIIRSIQQEVSQIRYNTNPACAGTDIIINRIRQINDSPDQIDLQQSKKISLQQFLIFFFIICQFTKEEITADRKEKRYSHSAYCLNEISIERFIDINKWKCMNTDDQKSADIFGNIDGRQLFSSHVSNLSFLNAEHGMRSHTKFRCLWNVIFVKSRQWLLSDLLVAPRSQQYLLLGHLQRL